MMEKINDEDKQIYGCTDPKWTGSLSSTMTYKGFDFSFMLYIKQGQWSRSYFHEQYMDISDRGRQKMSFDYYIPAGTPVLDKATGGHHLLGNTAYGVLTPILTIMKKPVAVTSVKAARE